MKKGKKKETVRFPEREPLVHPIEAPVQEPGIPVELPATQPIEIPIQQPAKTA